MIEQNKFITFALSLGEKSLRQEHNVARSLNLEIAKIQL